MFNQDQFVHQNIEKLYNFYDFKIVYVENDNQIEFDKNYDRNIVWLSFRGNDYKNHNGDKIIKKNMENLHDMRNNPHKTTLYFKQIKKWTDGGVHVFFDYTWEGETNYKLNNIGHYFKMFKIMNIDTQKTTILTNNTKNLGRWNKKINNINHNFLSFPFWLLYSHLTFNENNFKKKESKFPTKDILCLVRRGRPYKIKTLKLLLEEYGYSKTLYSLCSIKDEGLLELYPKDVHDIYDFLFKFRNDLTKWKSIQPFDDVISEVPITSDEFLFDTNPKWFCDTKISVIPETFYLSNPIFTNTETYESVIHITEKTYKSIAMLHPFILISGKKTLNGLKKFGFETFSTIINEDYDFMDDDKRIYSAINEVGKLVEKWDDKKVKDICLHNQKILFDKEHLRQLFKKYFINQI